MDLTTARPSMTSRRSSSRRSASRTGPTTSTRHTPLLGAMPELDSMAVVELVVTALEQRFGFDPDDDEITGEVFETLGTLAAFVDAKRPERPQSSASAGLRCRRAVSHSRS